MKRICLRCVFLSLLIGSAAAQQVATPVLNPGAKTATATLNITIVTETVGASIRYTTDNSTPSSTVGTLYSGPVTVSSTQTIKAIAYKTAMTDSDVATAAYTIVAPPSISSISPTSGSAGDSVTITGTGFGSTQGSGVAWLGTTLATVTSWSDTQVVATIASNASAGSARIRQNGTWSNDTSIDIAGITIDSLTPDNGLPGTSVTIAGSGFGSSQGTSKLAFGTVTSWSDTQIVATLSDGIVQVLKGGRASNMAYFTVNTPWIEDVSPVSGTSATTVTITGANFGSIQGSSTLRLGSEAATILTWTDTEITATPTSGAKSGIVRIDQSSMKSNTLKFSVPDGLGAISTLAPDIINMVVGETRPIQALDSNGAALTGLTWSSTDTGVVSLSASDPPILTAVAAGHVTITAGSASADVTVSATDLPLGTTLWENTLDGQWVSQIVPAVPSPTGVADVFAIQDNGSSTTVNAVTADGITAWVTEIPGYNVLVPDFQGGLVDIGDGIAKVDGLTGELGTPYYLDSGDDYGNIAVHPDGTVFVLVRHADEIDDTVVGIDLATGTQKFSVDAGQKHFSYNQLIIAGNGDAYVPYATAEDGADSVHWKISLLRIDTSGSATRIPIHDRYEYIGVEIPAVWFGLITNADTGVLLTWADHTAGGDGPGLFGTAIIDGSSVTSLNLEASFPDQIGPLMPILQAQDGSFIGTVYSDDGSFMIAFDSSGTVRWSAPLQPADTPAMLLADGSIVTQYGLVYDQSGAVIGQDTNPSINSWLGNAYTYGSVIQLASLPPEYAPTFATVIGGNPSSGSTGASTYLIPEKLYVRSFAPWAVFGPDPPNFCLEDCFAGDNRTFSTSLSATARVTGILNFWMPGAVAGSSRAFSDPSYDASHSRTATSHPSIKVTPAPVASGYKILLSYAGNNPLVSPSPDIDVHLYFSPSSSSTAGQICYSGHLTGDAFPNAEVFAINSVSTATSLLTFATSLSRNGGPWYLLVPASDDMGSFSNVCAAR